MAVGGRRRKFDITAFSLGEVGLPLFSSTPSQLGDSRRHLRREVGKSVARTHRVNLFVEAGRFGLWEDGLLTGRHVVRVQVGRNHFAPGAKKYLFCRSGKALRAQKITFEKEYSLLRKQSARGEVFVARKEY